MIVVVPAGARRRQARKARPGGQRPCGGDKIAGIFSTTSLAGKFFASLISACNTNHMPITVAIAAPIPSNVLILTLKPVSSFLTLLPFQSF